MYWSDFRLSDDLDFFAQGSVTDFGEALRTAVAAASHGVGRELNLRFSPPRGGWSRSTVESEFGELMIDINLEERAYLPVEEPRINFPYSDLMSEPLRIRCLSLAEILGNKWFMLDDRKEPRDLYDLWAALTRFAVPFEEIARGHRAKYSFPPLRQSLQSARQLADRWEIRLAHQLPNLPQLESAIGDIEGIFEKWSRSDA